MSQIMNLASRATQLSPAHRSGALLTRTQRQYSSKRCHQKCRSTRLSTVAAASPNICVVGGGVIGLTSALRIFERLPDATVTIIGDKIAAETTSEGAAGLWKPYAITGTDPQLVNRWGKETFEHYMSLFLSADAPAAGVIFTSAYELFHEQVEDPDWKDVVPSFRQLSSNELSVLDPTGEHVHGIAYDTIIAEGRLYMNWLLHRLEQHGAIIKRQKISSFSSLSSYDAVINCAGLGSRELARDPSMHGIRGHVLRVRAPWVRHHVESQGADSYSPAYIIPNSDTVVLGGTKQEGDEDITPRIADREAILKRCTAVVPSLASAEVVGEWVGLRPGRPAVRLELNWEAVEGTERGLLPVVHSYGHGGSGLTLAWGCAGDAVGLLVNALEESL